MNERSNEISRRRLLGFAAAGTSGLLLGGCDRLNGSEGFRSVLEDTENLTMRSQRFLMGDRLAREFGESDISPVFKANGSLGVTDPVYRGHFTQQFAAWALHVDGLVRQPLTLPLTALKGFPQRTQITRHDCVEGWSAIGKWQGPQLSAVLAQAGLLPEARYAVFHCADVLAGSPYYESIDLIDAFHPQTILAWQMNDQPLTEQHGAPIRLRVERQLGYKQAKYIMRIELRSTLAGLYKGKGGLWEDRSDYAWYAGI
ncbi:molybdopterin-dependent oxidoreductase [Novosphingobium sp.]|uniref:molybdopterin-dependent oxidoreductase n=1 Tax=Novosphingobium sp. TaxID=1874826 RepID=UPI0025CE47F0|nr:molybdopterin-dependent oxidoreductase [Novosphingobium sp.]